MQKIFIFAALIALFAMYASASCQPCTTKYCLAVCRYNDLLEEHAQLFDEFLYGPEDASVFEEEAAVEEQDELMGGPGVVNFARQHVGSPYKLGGTSFTTGIDCSSFVQKSFQTQGINLPRTSGAISQVGTPVTGGRQNWKPGDILSYPGHVGMFHVPPFEID